MAVAAPVQAGVHLRLRRRGGGVELHGVGLHSHDGAGVSGQLQVRNLRQHRIGEVLHHQRHTVPARPAQAQERSGLCLARLQRHAAPAERTAQAHQGPVVRALVHEQRLARRYRAHVDLMALQVVRERLLDVQDRREGARLVVAQAIQYAVHVLGIAHGAVEVGRQPQHRVARRDGAHRRQALVVPRLVVAAQLHLQRLQAVGADPVLQQRRVAVVGLVAGEVRRGQRVEAAHQVPRHQPARRRRQVVARVAAGERRVVEERRQIACQVIGAVGGVRRAPHQLAVGVVGRQVEGGGAHQGGEPGDRGVRGARAIGRGKQFRQAAGNEPVADLQRMTGLAGRGPGAGDRLGQVAQRLQPLGVGEAARPHPLHVERRFPPAHGGGPGGRRRGVAGGVQLDAGTGANHLGEHLGAELERYAGRYRQVVEAGSAEHCRLLAWRGHGGGV